MLDIPLGSERLAAYDEIIGDRWAPWLLLAIHETDGARFTDLIETPRLSRRVLSERLRVLINRGLVNTKTYSTRPLRKRYFLTERGLLIRHLLLVATHVAAGGAMESDPLNIRSHGASSKAPVHVTAATEVSASTRADARADLLLEQRPDHAKRIYAETIEPLDLYDERHRAQLVKTLVTWLASDSSTSVTAARLYAHRHTIRYRLGRIKELTGLDLKSTSGRERALLGIRARRVLFKDHISAANNFIHVDDDG